MPTPTLRSVRDLSCKHSQEICFHFQLDLGRFVGKPRKYLIFVRLELSDVSTCGDLRLSNTSFLLHIIHEK